MTLGSQLCLMAEYNQWMNDKLYAAAGRLSADALAADRKAFFGSILGTLNHLIVADTIWLKRFATHPAGYPLLDPILSLPKPTALDQTLFTDFSALAAHRKFLDQIISAWVGSIGEEDLDHVLSYVNSKGVAGHKRFASMLMHFFNHQTHHRGQTTTLLTQAGIDVGVTDLLALVPDLD